MILAEERLAGIATAGTATARTAEYAYKTSVEPNEKLKYKTRPKFKFMRVVLCLLFLIGVNLIVQSLLVLRANEIQRREVAIRNLEAQSVQLRIEMADLESFDRIQRLAQKELGMRVAGPNDYQCIAAAPNFKRELPQPYGYVSKIPSKPNLWAKLTIWLGSIGETMAQNP